MKHIRLIATVFSIFIFSLLFVAPFDQATAQQPADYGASARPALVQITYEYEFTSRGRSASATVSGTGIILNRQGYIVTNEHVVGDAPGLVNVKLSDGRTVQGTVVGTDRTTDVGVVKIAAGNYPVAQFGDSNRLQIGQRILLMGLSPNVEDAAQGDYGNVTARDGFMMTERGGKLEGLIRTTIIPSPGDSGGALVNSSGEVVGLLVIRRSDLASRRLVEGMTIPINTAMAMAQEIMARGYVIRPYTGLTTQGLTPQAAMTYRLQRGAGLLIQDIENDSPGDRAGLEIGDIIISVNGTGLASRSDFVNWIARTRPGHVMTLQVVHDNGSQSAKLLRIGQRPNDDDAFERMSYD